MTRFENRDADVRGSRLGYPAFILCLFLLLQISTASLCSAQEQTVFAADPSEPITRPIPLPDAVLQLLSKDDDIAGCLKENPIAHGESLASWFTASEIHLNGAGEADMVVLPVAKGDPYLCFHSVEGIGWFWVFRQTSGRYELVLKTPGLGLNVVQVKHNGYRDIQSGAQVGQFGTQITYRFEDGHYRESRK